ncbi:MAG: tetratricopeptide repeat protein [Gammaproteobacteria bacterium]|nr:tetratricopeptide repeat protein [Gammaproteobacteria bacterium]
MSLINQALKDIEKKKKAVDVVDEKELTAGLAAPNTHGIGSKKLAIIFLLLLVVIGLAALIYEYLPKKTTSQLASKKITAVVFQEVAKATKFTKQAVGASEETAKTASIATKAETMPQVQIEPVKSMNVPEIEKILNGYSFVSEHQVGLLALQLSGETHYAIEQNEDNTALTITLTTTKFVKKPVDFTANAWIKSLQFNEVGGDTLITVVLQPSVELQKALLVAKPHHELQLGFYNPDADAVKQKMQKVLLPLTSEQQAQLDYQEALTALQNKQIFTAITKLRGILKILPTYMPARETLATVLYRSGSKHEASRVARIGLSQDPDNMILIKLRAHIYVDQGLINSALQLLLQQHPDVNNDPNYYGFIAALYQRLGKYQIAAQIYAQLSQLQPTNATWLVGFGIALEGTGAINAAREAYTNALKYGANMAPALRGYVQDKLQK